MTGNDLIYLLIGVFIGVLIMFALTFLISDDDNRERRMIRKERELLEEATRLRSVVDLARTHGLPMWEEPTTRMHGKIVHPLNSTTRFDENGVPL